MTYNFDIAMSAKLSETVVHEMVTKAVEAQTGKRVAKVVVNYEGTKFDGYQVFFDTETDSLHPNGKTTNQKFIATTYENLNFRATKI